MTHGGSGRPDAIEHVGSESDRDKKVFGIALDLGKAEVSGKSARRVECGRRRTTPMTYLGLL